MCVHFVIIHLKNDCFQTTLGLFNVPAVFIVGVYYSLNSAPNCPGQVYGVVCFLMVKVEFKQLKIHLPNWNFKIFGVHMLGNHCKFLYGESKERVLRGMGIQAGRMYGIH